MNFFIKFFSEKEVDKVTSKFISINLFGSVVFLPKKIAAS